MNVITPTSYIFQAVFNTPYSQTPVVTSSYALTEYFEGGTGYDNVGWTIIGNVTTSYTTPPAPLQGAQSIVIDGITATSRTSRYITLSSQSFNDVWVKFLYHPTNHTASNDRDFVRIESGSISQASVNWRSNRVVRASCGSANATTTATMQTGSNYWVWIHYTAGSGGVPNSFLQVYFSTSSIRPASGSANFAQTGVGTLSGSVNIVSLYAQNLTSYGYRNIFDNLLVSDTEIINET